MEVVSLNKRQRGIQHPLILLNNTVTGNGLPQVTWWTRIPKGPRRNSTDRAEPDTKRACVQGPPHPLRSPT